MNQNLKTVKIWEIILKSIVRFLFQDFNTYIQIMLDNLCILKKPKYTIKDFYYHLTPI